MRKSSFGARMSTGPLRVKNDGPGARKSTAGINTPQGKRFTGMSSKGGSTMGHGSAMSHRSSTAGRSSGVGVRYSGIGVRSRSDVPKDPRPISDKGYQHRCIRTLIEFLMENKYPHPISQKLLLSPPSKEFFKIFEFIYRQLDPAGMGGKKEEEIPWLLKMLGYPFSIPRSSMHAVGTPHTWPHLLAALTWLVELVRFTQNISRDDTLDRLIFPPDGEDFDSVPDAKIKFEYTSQTYSAFLRGEDEYDAYDDELSKVLEEKYLGQSGGIGALKNEHARLRQEMELLDQEMERVDRLQEQQELMLLDERKFQDYLTGLENVIRKHDQMIHDAVDEGSSLEQDLKSAIAKNQHMQAIYEQQDMTPSDVERLRVARLELQRQEENLEREDEAINTDICKEELNMARLLQKVDSCLGEYHKLARSLRLIPSTTEMANGLNFELRSSVQDLDNRFDRDIKPALMSLKKRAMEEVQRLEGAKMQQDGYLEQRSEQVADMDAEIAQLEKGIKTKDEEIECRKQLYQRDMESLQATVDQLQREIRTRQTTSQISLQDAERELRETYSWAEQRKTEMVKKEQKYATFLTTVCSLVIDHKAHVQSQLKTMERDLSQALLQEQERTARHEQDSKLLRQILQEYMD